MSYKVHFFVQNFHFHAMFSYVINFSSSIFFNMKYVCANVVDVLFMWTAYALWSGCVHLCFAYFLKYMVHLHDNILIWRSLETMGVSEVVWGCISASCALCPSRVLPSPTPQHDVCATVWLASITRLIFD